jgi:hypothetical protein
MNHPPEGASGASRSPSPAEPTLRTMVISLLVVLILGGGLAGALVLVDTLDFSASACGGPGYGGFGGYGGYGCAPYGPGGPGIGGVTVSPARVAFNITKPGSISYQLVTITNRGRDTQTLDTAAATPNPPFFPTFGGTCNVTYAFHIPGGASCTFQWGFHPSAPGNYAGTGVINFAGGTVLHLALAGHSA